jgi:AraC-like DNA-binding protein
MFTRNNSSQRIKNRFTWFQKWILERQTFKTLSRDSGLSIDTLQRIFYAFLRQSPTVRILKRSRVYLRLDATYFEQFCMLCYQDNEDGYTQLIRFSDGEHFGEIKEDLDNLIKLGVQIESITTDGHKSILKAIKKSLPPGSGSTMPGTYSKSVFAMADAVSKAHCWCGIKKTGSFIIAYQNTERPPSLESAIRAMASATQSLFARKNNQ